MHEPTPPAQPNRPNPAERPLSAVEIELRKKQALRDEVRVRFARYGQAVCDLIWQEIQKPRGLQTLVLQLGLRVSMNDENMLTSLTHYMKLQGSEQFLALLRGQSGAGAGPTPEKACSGVASATSTAPEPVPGIALSGKINVARESSALSGVLPLSETQAGRAAQPLSGRLPLPEEQGKTGLAPQPKQPNPSAVPASPRPQIQSETYSGPDRRAGLDRRTVNRRADMEAVMLNRRFGGDRRRDDRRKENRNSDTA